ncbi:alanyl-tRNA synthetase [Metschnikowia bicuspidata var. bicuspidata NRRL YB-4993]|uniref:Alanyl-tRNA synthetase n=1 Tax=Metschnikowia bicuspidata var. bicuspidata NRRL YB-4993 TaxID=869754 RepID=A0A1A0H5A0_9ASCO|nr:alanyl-tRNA synthetase [Metschnikowia bicuspidata var. bicuspidata NRRL YB-4993]OBA19098.1 alanyl-tRNA synthetase [Metschnikowia bicuspidata var. bicuspidata NRRL YB-4993]
MASCVTSSTIVGALACQRNSFLKTFQTTVVSCKKYEPIKTSKDKQNQNKKSTEKEQKFEESLYALELQDTILFPEGGGQPFDTGNIATASEKIPVQMVLRQELTAVHVTPKPVEVGSQVSLEVDWKRRLDIMQQHTGQHLISAVFDTYDLETLSWSMGDTINYIELPRKVEQSIIDEVSEKVNDMIVQGIPIKVTTPDQLGREIDTSHIPDDYDLSKGIVRVVQIGDIDSNPCCGTHLTNTGQIQAVSFLHQTNVRGGNSRLHFMCGSRVSRQLAAYHLMLKDVLGTQLSCQIDEVASKVADLNQNYKKSLSRESTLLKELAAIEASKVFTLFRDTNAKIASIYRQDSSPEYLTMAQKELTTLINANKDAGVDLSLAHTVVYLNGDYKSGNGGMVKIMGPLAEEIQQKLKCLIKNIKGGGKGTSFQGKITKYEKGEVESVLRYLESLALPE